MAKYTSLPKGLKSKPLALLVFGLLWVGLSQAQVSTNTSGGDASCSGGSTAYSIGQLVYNTVTGSTGSVAQGVQYAYEIFSVGIADTELNISLIAFPNPTADNVTLQISDYNNEQLSYLLFDLQGKLLNRGQIVAQQTQISMKGFPTATYFVNVLNQENKHVRTFKIIKN